METFGLVQVKLRTPYTRVVSHYFSTEWDMIGVYYSNENKLELILYDVYTSERIHDISFMGELLLWRFVEEINTTKFYCDHEHDIREGIASLLFCITAERKGEFRRLLLEESFESEISRVLKERIATFSVKESSPSIYRRTSEGIRCKALENLYNELHLSFFVTLAEIDREGLCPLWKKTIRPQSQKTSLACKFKASVKESRDTGFQRLRLNKSDLNLGEQAFVAKLLVEYQSNLEEKKLELNCGNFQVLLPGRSDLTFFEKNTLLEVLRYIERSADDFCELERAVVNELSRRSLL